MLTQVRDADLHLLRVFVAVVECGGLAAAQNRLNVASSTISTQITALESRLGLRLCERGRGGFHLTPEGHVVLEATYRMLAGLNAFRSTLDGIHGKPTGSLRLVLLDNAVGNASFKLGETLTRSRTEIPFLRFEVLQMPPGELQTAIINCEADVGISFVSNPPASLDHQHLFHERQVLCCGRGHPLFEVTASEIDRPLLMNQDWVRDGYKLPADFPFSDPPISTAVASQVEGTLHFILAGTHIGFLPVHVTKSWVEAGLLRALLPDRFHYDLPFKLITRRDRSEENIIATFCGLLLATHALPT